HCHSFSSRCWLRRVAIAFPGRRASRWFNLPGRNYVGGSDSDVRLAERWPATLAARRRRFSIRKIGIARQSRLRKFLAKRIEHITVYGQENFVPFQSDHAQAANETTRIAPKTASQEKFMGI